MNLNIDTKGLNGRLVPCKFYLNLLCGIALLFIAKPIYAQWPTSTYADTSLFACFGFYNGIMTYEDGSCMVLGSGERDAYIAKFDENGIRIWPDQIKFLNNPSSVLYGNPYMISDGDGGAFVWWEDHRGATYSDNRYINNALFMQLIDKDGNIRWQQNGLEIEPAPTGKKYCYATTDGAGGFVLAGADIDNSTPTIKTKTWVRRYNGNGNLLWMKDIDSATSPLYAGVGKVTRIGANIIISSSPLGKMIDTSGNLFSQPPVLNNWLAITERDSIFYTVRNTGISDTTNDSLFTYLDIIKYDVSFDTIWTSLLRVYNEGEYGTSNQAPWVADGIGGIFFVRSVKDDDNFIRTRVYHLDSTGKNTWGFEKVYLPDFASRFAFKDNKGGIILYSLFANDASRFDFNGNPVWENQPISIITDNMNAYFSIPAGDNKGGVIVCFWRTYGALWLKHSGRTGVVGRLTGIYQSETLPTNFQLFQNYPNPFNPVTLIRYQLQTATDVKLSIYNLLGQEMSVLVNEKQTAGNYSAIIDASQYPSGVYFYTLETTNFTETKKMILIR